ncbi:MAG: DUF1178 family protein [Pseudomonadota bacterium]
MIRYDLKCCEGHVFEAWFASSAAFDEQADRGLVTCAICGTTKVEKALMAPRVPAKSNRRAADAPGPAPQSNGQPMMSAPVPPEMAEKLSELRKTVEANSDYVGKDFASEARKIHLGETEARSIYGEASGEEAKSLMEDGVPVAPLPFMPKRNG